MESENLQRIYEELMDLFAEIEAKMFEFSSAYAELKDTVDSFEDEL